MFNPNPPQTMDANLYLPSGTKSNSISSLLLGKHCFIVQNKIEFSNEVNLSSSSFYLPTSKISSRGKSPKLKDWRFHLCDNGLLHLL